KSSGRLTPRKLIRAKPPDVVVRRPKTATCCGPKTSRAIALSLPPLQQNSIASTSLALFSLPALGFTTPSLVFSAEAVIHAHADIAAKRGIAKRVLIKLVKEVRSARVRRHASGKFI